MIDTPAGMLEGNTLDSGWTVVERITRKKTSTGGHFSVGYKVQNGDRVTAFLKAFDFSGALQQPDTPRALEALLKAFNYERTLLESCKEKRLSRILTPIAEGTKVIPGFGDVSIVHYLIFELADGDVRDIVSEFNKLDVAWCLRSLHEIAVGIKQLHGNGIAHQDLKPSNVMYSGNTGSKLGDLGRSSAKDKISPHEGFSIAGDTGYAPLDLNYSDFHPCGFEKRLLTDLYLLGSLIFFYFANVSATHMVRMKLQGHPLGNDTFEQDLPYIQKAFEESIEDLSVEIRKVTKVCADEIIEIARQLCEPDPTRRGVFCLSGNRSVAVIS